MTTRPRPGTYAGYVTYCAGCGHDKATHRGGRCWVDALGRPLYRTRSLIGCLCDGFTEVVPPLDQARAASKAVADQALRDEIEFLRGEVADLQRRNDRLAVAWNEAKAERDRIRAAACRVVDARPPIWSSVIGEAIWAAIDQLAHVVRPLTVVEPDDDELAASIARHPAGKRLGQP